MQNLQRRAISSAIGVAAIYAWWTWGPKSTDEQSDSVQGIPRKVWDGGGGLVTIDLETTAPGRASIVFETNSPVDDPAHRLLDTWETVGAGHHSYVIDVPPGTRATVEIEADKPVKGDRTAAVVTVGGREVGRDEVTLEGDLEAGTALFAQLQFEDLATGELGGDF